MVKTNASKKQKPSLSSSSNTMKGFTFGDKEFVLTTCKNRRKTLKTTLSSSDSSFFLASLQKHRTSLVQFRLLAYILKNINTMDSIVQSTCLTFNCGPKIVTKWSWNNFHQILFWFKGMFKKMSVLKTSALPKLRFSRTKNGPKRFNETTFGRNGCAKLMKRKKPASRHVVSLTAQQTPRHWSDRKHVLHRRWTCSCCPRPWMVASQLNTWLSENLKKFW